MKIGKLNLGLSILLTALVLAQGAMAFPSQQVACTNCHTLSSSITISTTSPAEVTPGQVFDVGITWSGGSSVTAVKWPSVNDNAAFGLNPAVVVSSSASGTATSTLTAPSTEGSYKVTVYVATTGPITNFKDIAITVKAATPAPVLTTIDISPATASLIVGATQTFTASPKDQNGNPIDAAITWTSSNTTVGNVDAGGIFTAAAAGTTTIQAANGTVNGTAAVTVSAPAPVLTTITVSPATANLVVGTTQTFTASPKDQNGNPIDAAITWTSSNTTVGNVDAGGIFTAAAAGTTTVQAANGTVNGTAAVTVTVSAPAPVLTTITVSPATANLVVGTTQTFTASPKDQNGNPIDAAITWTSSNTTVGNVDAGGNFTAAAAGTTTVQAANGTVNGTAAVTVTVSAPAPVLTTITVSPATANLVVGANQTFMASPKDQNGNPIDAAITWTSSNTTVGNVDTNGNFTATAAGTTTIQAANGTVNGTAAVTVTVSTPVKYYIVTFIVTDNVTGKPIKDAKISMDRVKRETNRSGIANFKKVSSGSHSYKIQAEHYEMIKGSIEVGANMTVSVKLTPKKDKEHGHDKDKEQEKKHEEKVKEKKQTDNETDEEDD